MGLEIGEDAARVARAAVAPFGDRLHVVTDPREVIGRFPVVLALEVLEHIQDDAAALREWREWVAPGGRLILTVPAHAHYWTRSDELGGHVRRYERDSLQRVLRDAGLTVGTFWSFGFPLTAITTRLRDRASEHRLKEVKDLSPEQRTLRSSFDSTRSVGADRVLGTAVEAAGLIFHWMQVPFLSTDLGASYLVECRPAG
jgi:SAM-dependent methyltransferase